MSDKKDNTVKTYIDPPKGWLYGFPKEYNNDKDIPMRQWLEENGYPKEELEYWGENIPLRFFDR